MSATEAVALRARGPAPPAARASTLRRAEAVLGVGLLGSVAVRGRAARPLSRRAFFSARGRARCEEKAPAS
eukprot:12820568-Alexandrium_andersonii.AAC.1